MEIQSNWSEPNGKTNRGKNRGRESTTASLSLEPGLISRKGRQRRANVAKEKKTDAATKVGGGGSYFAKEKGTNLGKKEGF